MDRGKGREVVGENMTMEVLKLTQRSHTFFRPNDDLPEEPRRQDRGAMFIFLPGRNEHLRRKEGVDESSAEESCFYTSDSDTTACALDD